MNVGTGDAAVQNVADNRYREIRKVFFEVPNREHIQQALRGVRMAAIARVNHMHMRRYVLGNQIRRTGAGGYPAVLVSRRSASQLSRASVTRGSMGCFTWRP